MTAIPADLSQNIDEKVIRFVEESPYSKIPTTGGQVSQNQHYATKPLSQDNRLGVLKNTLQQVHSNSDL